MGGAWWTPLALEGWFHLRRLGRPHLYGEQRSLMASSEVRNEPPLFCINLVAAQLTPCVARGASAAPGSPLS